MKVYSLEERERMHRLAKLRHKIVPFKTCGGNTQMFALYEQLVYEGEVISDIGRHIDEDVFLSLCKVVQEAYKVAYEPHLIEKHSEPRE